jgi:predicted nucleic acid-binding protein
MVTVADSSYIIEGLLKDSSLFRGAVLYAPDYGLYEVLNAVWKHQVLLKRIKEREPVLSLFFDLIAAERIKFVALAEETVRNAYELATKTRTPIYDAAFVALAIELGAKLETFDEKQSKLFAEMTSDGQN